MRIDYLRVCIAGFYLILSGVVTAQPPRYEPSPMEVAHAMLELAQVAASDVVYDLGCGDGRIVIAAAARFGARGVCVDIDPERIAESRENARRAGVEERIVFLNQDLFATDLSDATVVTLFLSPQFNDRLRPKLQRELAPGARVVSHYHGMTSWRPKTVRHVGDRTIFLWVL
jgi:SAM-dependent methyltransferase